MSRKMMLFSIVWVLLLSGCAVKTPIKLTGSADWIPRDRTNDGQYLVRYPAMRMHNPATYFAAEKKFIDQRREKIGVKEKARAEIGLALSGGGIRSNAFQLGLLSGLHSQVNSGNGQKTSRNYLHDIDYLSAVSGGSWAAGAYKSATVTDEAFFDALDMAVTRDDLDNNDPRMHPLFNSYQAALHELLQEKKDVLDLHVGYTAHEAWRKMLKTNVLGGNDPLLEDLNGRKDADGNADPQYSEAARRPYVIFNATHDSSISILRSATGDMEHSFPFELTADYIGTLVDCGNTDYCSFTADNEYVGTFARTSDTYVPPLFLSHAMAISGAVVPQKVLGVKLNMMYWKIDLPDFDENVSLHRGAMTLSDGGHAENLGALALIERRVPLIILSDAAYDPEDTEGDLQALEHHADKLFGVGLRLVGGKKALFHRYSYYLKSEPGKEIGKIIYLKARNSDQESFDDYLLRHENTFNLKTYLDTTRNVTKLQFPSDKTYATAYDYRLVFSYYLLGRYYGTDVLAPELERIRSETGGNVQEDRP